MQTYIFDKNSQYMLIQSHLACNKLLCKAAQFDCFCNRFCNKSNSPFKSLIFLSLVFVSSLSLEFSLIISSTAFARVSTTSPEHGVMVVNSESAWGACFGFSSEFVVMMVTLVGGGDTEFRDPWNFLSKNCAFDSCPVISVFRTSC